MSSMKLLAAIILSVLIASPAFADRGGHGKHHDHRWRPHHPHYYAPVIRRTISINAPPQQSVMIMPMLQEIIFNPRAVMYQDSWGNYCREYRKLIYTDGTIRRRFGTACSQPSGMWTIIN